MEKKPKVTAQLSQTLGEDPANYVAKVCELLYCHLCHHMPVHITSV